MASQVAVATDGRAHPSGTSSRETRDRYGRENGLDGRENGRGKGREPGNQRPSGRSGPTISRPITDTSPVPEQANGHAPVGYRGQAGVRGPRVSETAAPDASPAAAPTGPGANGATRPRGWRAVPPRPLRQPAEGAQTPPREAAQPPLVPASTRAGIEDAVVVPVRTPAPTAAIESAGSGEESGSAEEYAQLTVPMRALEPVASPAVRPEVRGEWGPLIDSLRDLFAHDRAVASTGSSARCGLCYLHHPLADLEYREEEGYYVCASCKGALGSSRLPMVRRQQRAGR